MKRSALAVWSGSLNEGTGNLTVPSGVLHSTQYSFGSRFETGPGMNPEELIAGAHAGCYAMAAAGILSDAGFPPDRLEVTAEITMENIPPTGWTIAASHLTLNAHVLHLSPEKFQVLAEQAKACAVTRVLNATVTLEAKLM
ncbi:MAG: OsmC family peroxiredoxin [Opitutaceae bacterium]